MRSILTKATRNTRRQAARALFVALTRRIGTRLVGQGGEQDGCRRDHFPHPGHTSKSANRSLKGNFLASYPCPSGPSACPTFTFRSKVAHTLQGGPSIPDFVGNLMWCSTHRNKVFRKQTDLDAWFHLQGGGWRACATSHSTALCPQPPPRTLSLTALRGRNSTSCLCKRIVA